MRGNDDFTLGPDGQCPYGVSLWPILQDLGQLESLYGRDGMHTFFGNSDAHIFFGNTDALTLDYIARRIGVVGAHELGAPPMARPFELDDGLFSASPEVQQAEHRAREENRMRRYQHESAGQGRDRLAADAVRDHVMKGHGDAVARSMIVFARGRDVLSVRLWPYFQPKPQPALAVPTAQVTPAAVPQQFSILGNNFKELPHSIRYAAITYFIGAVFAALTYIRNPSNPDEAGNTIVGFILLAAIAFYFGKEREKREENEKNNY